jgi:phosphoribosylglycinamide formyltransferase-1
MPIVVLISGNGSNLQAILDAAADSLPVNVAGVISDRPDAYGLERERRVNVPACCIDRRKFQNRQAFEKALKTRIEQCRPGLVVLAGFMRVLSAAFVTAFEGQMLNVHPSLLPRYRGLDTHRQALEAGDCEHGASVHFVTAELDSGPVVLQAPVPVLPGDNAERLQARVLQREHIILPLAIEWFATGRLKLRDDKAWLDNRELQEPRVLQGE